MIKKKHGVYYTPIQHSSAIVYYIFRNYKHLSGKLDILEPSCGDGSFIYSLKNNVRDCNQRISLDIVDIDDEQLQNVQSMYSTDFKKMNSFHCDFLDFFESNKKKYNMVIGNPPYVKRDYLSSTQKEKCRNLNSIAYGHDYSVYNLWVAFLISSSLKLKEDGVLIFVLPKEFLHVNFANDLRHFLYSKYERIELMSLLNVSFEGAEQDTIVFIGYRKHQATGTYYFEIPEESVLKTNKLIPKAFIKDLLSIPKMSFLAQNNYNLCLLKRLGEKMHEVGVLCHSAPGVVTGANSFFIVSSKIISKYKLHRYAKKIIQKGEYINNNVIFSKENFDALDKHGKNCYLLYFERDFEDNIPPNVNSYFSLKKDELLKRYKIGNRKPWYRVPNLQPADCIFFKRSHNYPKLILNDSEAHVTDIGYIVSINEPYQVESFIFSFYNSYTLCMAELEGRSYAGGVLELTPSEFKKLYIPYTKINKRQFKKFERLMKNGDIEKVLDYTDKITLNKEYEITAKHIKTLRAIRKELVDSRQKK